MAHWGIAMSHYHQLWSPPGPKEIEDAQVELEQAGRLNGSPREKLFIAAATAYFKDADHVAPQTRAKAYAQVMDELARSNPKDTEVQVFYALSLIGTASPQDATHANQKRAAAILETVYRHQPDHPGAAHYLIHTYDSAELAPRGLAAARAYSKIAPSAPHALHMPSHIYTRLGLWEDSIDSNRAARAAAHEQGDLGEELHAMDYLTYAYLQRGKDAQAAEVVASLREMAALARPGSDFKVGYAATVMPIRLAVERHAWSDVAGLEPRESSAPLESAIICWARAMGSSRAGQPRAADPDIAKIGPYREELRAAGNAYWATQVDILDKEAKAWQLAAEQPDRSVELLRSAADEEDAVEKSPTTPGPIVPAREQLGELLLQQHHPKEALAEFQTALVGAPGRRGALRGGAAAADLLGDTRTASQMRAKL